jgi:hypothetical protein
MLSCVIMSARAGTDRASANSGEGALRTLMTTAWDRRLLPPVSGPIRLRRSSG